MSPPIEITLLTKAGGPLTKRISLAEDGSLKSDGSACLMGRGVARRARFADPHAFADCIGKLAQNEAITLGVLRLDLPDKVEIITKRELQKLNGAARPDLIARAGGHIVHPTGQLALALLDFDTKGMPLEVAARLKPGGYWAALVLVLPELASTARVTRRSTSSGIYRSDTGAKLPGSDGVHVFVLVKDGTDAERFLTTLHERCWLAGFGWLMIGAGGQLLERSIVDRMVAAPERLVFEGAPVLEPPLAQDQQSRRPIVTEGDVLDTVASCPPLSIVEHTKLRELRAKEAARLAPEVAKSRAAFITRQCQRLAERTGTDQNRARRVVERQCSGVLLPDIILPFDDPELAHCTVADVLADPDRFEGATLADPLEGVEYGICKARVMRRTDGTPWVHSFAHGRGIVFRVPPELEAILPKPVECTPSAVAAAMRYLTHGWLCDLACDYTGRCIVIAGALTIIERVLLSERPAFFMTAGQRGGGKTTTVNMVSLAVLGFRAAAAACLRARKSDARRCSPISAKGCHFWHGITYRGARLYPARQSRSRSPPRLTAIAFWGCLRPAPPLPSPSRSSPGTTLRRGATSPRARFPCV